MTNDSRKGWMYKARTDANHRWRRRPEIRNPVERFRRNAPMNLRRCQSRSMIPHEGPLEVHHVGGRLTSEPRLVFMCRRHNRMASHIRGFFRPGTRDEGWGTHLTYAGLGAALAAVLVVLGLTWVLAAAVVTGVALLKAMFEGPGASRGVVVMAAGAVVAWFVGAHV